jgi:hypothetical protein
LQPCAGKYQFDSADLASFHSRQSRNLNYAQEDLCRGRDESMRPGSP